jgi:hypothetical protein
VKKNYRPPTAAECRKIVKRAKAGLPPSLAAHAARIEPALVGEWLKRGQQPDADEALEAFVSECVRGQIEFNARVLAMLIQGAARGNRAAIKAIRDFKKGTPRENRLALLRLAVLMIETGKVPELDTRNKITLRKTVTKRTTAPQRAEH